jgi:hypothetical protein
VVHRHGAIFGAPTTRSLICDCAIEGNAVLITSPPESVRSDSSLLRNLRAPFTGYLVLTPTVLLRLHIHTSKYSDTKPMRPF